MNKFLIFILILILGLLVGAAVTNPTESESKEIVKSTVLTYAEKYVENQIEKSGIPLAGVGLSIGKKFAPKLWDKAVTTETEDYFIFTYFKSDINYMGINKNLLSGIIVFGQLIPLDSELKDDISTLKQQLGN